MAAEHNRIMEHFSTNFNTMRTQQAQAQQLVHHQQQMHQQQQQQQQQHMVNNLMAPPMMNGATEIPQQARPHRPSSAIGPSQQSAPQQPQPPSQPPRAPTSLPIKRKQHQPSGSGAVSTPSPAPASTPVASTPTSTAAASSPPASTTKSPKSKAAAKPKPAPINAKQRRASKVAPPVAPAPVPVELTQSSATANGKRPREEENSSGSGGATTGGASQDVASEPSPPKRFKTEWEAQPSDALRKKTEPAANVKSDEDTSAFLEQMTELIKLGNTDISDTLEMILKGYGSVPDAIDGTGMPLAGPSNGNREPTPPPMPVSDAFDEFFDFSFGTVEDEESISKAPTPDLISSSSTNPSPESNHEAEAGHHMLTSTSSSTMEIKTEEMSDLLRLGTWKEIDGGEAAYYQTPEWKWDSPNLTLDQPWAIFNS